jgi:hypothetical protein
MTRKLIGIGWLDQQNGGTSMTTFTAAAHPTFDWRTTEERTRMTPRFSPIDDDGPHFDEPRNAPVATQDAPGRTKRIEPTYQDFTLSDLHTGETVHITIERHVSPTFAQMTCWPSSMTYAEANKADALAWATIGIEDEETITSYVQRIHNEAAILGMDTLRALSTPLYREPPTAGEA